MPALPAAPLLLSALLGGASVSTAQTPAPGVRRIELRADAPAQMHEVRISPGHGTLLFFDTPVQRGTVVLKGEERFLLATLGENARAYTLLPSDALRPGERLPLTVSFTDGDAPGTATFQLVVHAALPETQVNVYRHPRPLDSFRQEAQEQRARAEQCETRLTEVLASQAEEGLSGLEAAGLLGTGIALQKLNDVNDSRDLPAEGGLLATKGMSFRASGRVAVRLLLELENASAAPWEAEGAALVSTEGIPLKVLKVWQERPVFPGQDARVLVEAEAPEGSARGPHVLKLWGKGGDRPMSIPDVTFPD
jgi:uncharacterized protein (TIGR02268 family)